MSRSALIGLVCGLFAGVVYSYFAYVTEPAPVAYVGYVVAFNVVIRGLVGYAAAHQASSGLRRQFAFKSISFVCNLAFQRLSILIISSSSMPDPATSSIET